MSEAKFKRIVLQGFVKRNAMVFHIVGSVMQEPGWPDEYIHHTRWQGFLEFKGKNTKLLLKQKIILQRLETRRKGSAFVVREPNRVESWNGSLLYEFSDSGDLLQWLSSQLTDNV